MILFFPSSSRSTNFLDLNQISGFFGLKTAYNIIEPPLWLIVGTTHSSFSLSPDILHIPFTLTPQKFKFWFICPQYIFLLFFVRNTFFFFLNFFFFCPGLGLGHSLFNPYWTKAIFHYWHRHWLLSKGFEFGCLLQNTFLLCVLLSIIQCLSSVVVVTFGAPTNFDNIYIRF